ncbi:MAG: EamA family transporter [Alphaproteobacteria bacterium]
MVVPVSAFVVLTAVTYVTHAVFVKYASGKVDPYSAVFYWSCGAFVVGFISLLFGKYTQSSFSTLPGTGFALAAGFVIALGSLGYLLAFQRGVDFSFATPLVNISVVIGGLVFGYLLFKEDVNALRLSGVVLGCVSIFLLTRSGG